MTRMIHQPTSSATSVGKIVIPISEGYSLFGLTSLKFPVQNEPWNESHRIMSLLFLLP